MSDEPTPMPDFKTREEEAAYFDDPENFWKEWEQGEPVRVRRVYDHPMQVRLDADLDRQLQRLADEQGIRKSTLARMWLAERIKQEQERRAS